MNLFFFFVIYGKYGYLIILLINTLVLDIYIYIYRKFDAFDKFIEFKVESDNLLGKHMKTLPLDRGNVSSRFDPFYMEHKMIS